jgi:hypothetical protein
MNETLILAIIAVAAAVLLLGMPFWLFGKRKNAVCVPAPVPGEEHRPATAEEIAVLRKMVTDLFSGPVVNDGDRRCVREAIALWQPGTSFAKLMQNLVAELEIMPSVDRYQLYDYLREMRDSLEEIAEMRGLDRKMAENTRICRIGNACFLAALKEANF